MNDPHLAEDKAVISPELLIRAYGAGIFPMAESREDSNLSWYAPHPRGVIYLEDFHIPKRLARQVKSTSLTVVVNREFDQIVALCAKNPTRQDSWISPQLQCLYRALFERGICKSVGVWSGADLVGGVFGPCFGGVFIGESMFSLVKDASKIALVHLFARLAAGRFELVDIQFTTEHLIKFGACDISRNAYMAAISALWSRPCDFHSLPAQITGAEALRALYERRSGCTV